MCMRRGKHLTRRIPTVSAGMPLRRTDSRSVCPRIVREVLSGCLHSSSPSAAKNSVPSPVHVKMDEQARPEDAAPTTKAESQLKGVVITSSLSCILIEVGHRMCLALRAMLLTT